MVLSEPATLSDAPALASKASTRPPTAIRMNKISARWLSRSAVNLLNFIGHPRK
jgi:hypothetical protein